jgi:hypothetical protein
MNRPLKGRDDQMLAQHLIFNDLYCRERLK